MFVGRELLFIPDPPTLRLLGYSFANVQIIANEEFEKYTVRPPLESVITGRLIQQNGRPEVYIIIGGEKRHVPDPLTLQMIQQLNLSNGGQRTVEIMTETEVNRWTTGDALVSMLRT